MYRGEWLTYVAASGGIVCSTRVDFNTATTPGGGRIYRPFALMMGMPVLPPPRFGGGIPGDGGMVNNYSASSSENGAFSLHPAQHIPALKEETLRFLAPEPGKIIFDGTLGSGRHARAILEKLLPDGMLIGIDRDPKMLDIAAKSLEEFPRRSYRLFEGSYAQIDEVLEEVEVEAVDGIFIDAGFATPQILDPERGFSYRQDGPLDMRYSPDEPSAQELINSLSQEELADAFRRFGEVRFAGRVADRIVRQRAIKPISSTQELADIIEKAVPGRTRKQRPARMFFQGLRILVNKELDHLKTLLEMAPSFLNPGGAIVVISYHSLEDRLVKQSFRKWAEKGLLQVETRKVVTPSEAEARENPQARSARLRAATRLRDQQKGELN